MKLGFAGEAWIGVPVRSEQQAVFENTARAMPMRACTSTNIPNCFCAHPAYGEGVARALGMKIATDV